MCVHIDVVIMLECFSIILKNYFFACLLNLVCMCVQELLESRDSVTPTEDNDYQKQVQTASACAFAMPLCCLLLSELFTCAQHHVKHYAPHINTGIQRIRRRGLYSSQGRYEEES